MKVSQQALIEACEQLKIPYKILHKHKILVKVEFNPPLYFVHHHKAFNNEDMVRICKDKDLSYTLLHEHINIPKWKSYLDPNCNPKYQDLCNFRSYTDIAKDINETFEKPVIVKKNKGSTGINVFICKNLSDITKAVEEIYNRNSQHYDYVAITQKFIKIKNEYRVVAYKKKVLLVYEKDISNAKYVGNLSPLHWEKSKAKLVEDLALSTKLEKFMQPIFDTLPINFVGLDIAIDQDDNLWLIELNSSPGFDIFVRDNGMEPLVEMTKTILKDYLQDFNEK